MSRPGGEQAGTFPDILTERLMLVAMTRESLLCQLASSANDGGGPDREAEMRAELGRLLTAQVPEGWPHENWEPHVCEYLLKLIEGDSEAAGWCRYLMVREGEGRILVGTFGAGFPRADAGESEIGYGLLPAWQRQGYAVEAVMAMLPWLESRRRSGQQIRAFVAQTFPHLRGSIRVLEKCGFEAAGAGFEEGTILFRKMGGRER